MAKEIRKKEQAEEAAGSVQLRCPVCRKIWTFRQEDDLMKMRERGMCAVCYYKLGNKKRPFGTGIPPGT